MTLEKALDPDMQEIYQEILHIRHHSLFVPRDFDLSPYFEVVKPTLAVGFDPHLVTWSEPPVEREVQPQQPPRGQSPD